LWYKDDLALALRDQAKLDLERNRPAEAERALQQAITIFEYLCRVSPKSFEFTASLASCYTLMGDLQRESVGGGHLALTWYDKAVSRLDDTLTIEPDQADPRGCLQDALWGRARTLARARSFCKAIAECDRALTLDDDGGHRVRLRLHRALMRACLDDHDQAAAEVEEATRVPDESLRRDDLEGAARVLSVCAAVAARAADSTEAEREQRSAAYAGRAVRYLKRAHAAGMFPSPGDRAGLLHDPDFSALRPYPDFQLLMMDLSFPAEPFAQGRRGGPGRSTSLEPPPTR
jgi:tetratricopeptide (TPR) repeat protein